MVAKILTALLGVNPWALALGAFLIVGGAFGGGFYSATRVYANAQATAIAVAVKAQKDRDLKQHNEAVTVSGNVEKADKAHDRRVDVIVKSIHEPDAPSACNLPADVAKALTDAGAF